MQGFLPAGMVLPEVRRQVDAQCSCLRLRCWGGYDKLHASHRPSFSALPASSTPKSEHPPRKIVGIALSLLDLCLAMSMLDQDPSRLDPKPSAAHDVVRVVQELQVVIRPLSLH
eukprot:1070284-Amphidinium_carterae.1